MKQHRSTPGLTAALATIAILFTACSDDADGPAASPPSTSEPSPTGAGSATDVAPKDYSIIGATHLDGPGRWALTAAGEPDAPMAVFDVPAGFQARESFVWTDVRGFGQLTYWAPTRVPADPCNVDKPSKPLGPTVEDLAAALVSQQRTTTTEPVPVELDGHRGLYLELQSPKNFDYAACRPEGGMLIWEAGEAVDGRGLEEPATDRYWIMDVGGQRVVVTALSIGRVSESIERVIDVAKTTTFVAPE